MGKIHYNQHFTTMLHHLHSIHMKSRRKKPRHGNFRSPFAIAISPEGILVTRSLQSALCLSLLLPPRRPSALSQARRKKKSRLKKKKTLWFDGLSRGRFGRVGTQTYQEFICANRIYSYNSSPCKGHLREKCSHVS